MTEKSDSDYVRELEKDLKLFLVGRAQEIIPDNRDGWNIIMVTMLSSTAALMVTLGVDYEESLNDLRHCYDLQLKMKEEYDALNKEDDDEG